MSGTKTMDRRQSASRRTREWQKGRRNVDKEEFVAEKGSELENFSRSGNTSRGRPRET